MEKIRVLVVDDSVVVRRVVTEELTAQPDIEVAGTAANGRIALEKMNQLAPHLVILDVEMPDMDGLTALAHLRNSHPRTPVIMFSSLTKLGAAATLEALALGAADFFAKPAGPGGLDAARQLIRQELAPAIRAAVRPKSPRSKIASPPSAPVSGSPARPAATAAQRVDVVAIGGSTGGPNCAGRAVWRVAGELSDAHLGRAAHAPHVYRSAGRSPVAQLAHRGKRSSGLRGAAAGSGLGRSRRLSPGRGSGRSRVLPQDQSGAAGELLPAGRRSLVPIGGRNVRAPLPGRGADRHGTGRPARLRSHSRGRRADLAKDEETSVVWGMPGYVVRAGLADRVAHAPRVGGGDRAHEWEWAVVDASISAAEYEYMARLLLEHCAGARARQGVSAQVAARSRGPAARVREPEPADQRAARAGRQRFVRGSRRGDGHQRDLVFSRCSSVRSTAHDGSAGVDRRSAAASGSCTSGAPPVRADKSRIRWPSCSASTFPSSKPRASISWLPTFPAKCWHALAPADIRRSKSAAVCPRRCCSSGFDRRGAAGSSTNPCARWSPLLR